MERDLLTWSCIVVAVKVLAIGAVLLKADGCLAGGVYSEVRDLVFPVEGYVEDAAYVVC